MRVQINALLPELARRPAQLLLERLDPLLELGLAVAEALRQDVRLELGVELGRQALDRLLELFHFGGVLGGEHLKLGGVGFGARGAHGGLGCLALLFATRGRHGLPRFGHDAKAPWESYGSD